MFSIKDFVGLFYTIKYFYFLFSFFREKWGGDKYQTCVILCFIKYTHMLMALLPTICNTFPNLISQSYQDSNNIKVYFIKTINIFGRIELLERSLYPDSHVILQVGTLINPLNPFVSIFKMINFPSIKS